MYSHGDEHTFVRQRHADSRVFAEGRPIPQPQLSTDSCDLQLAAMGIPCFPPVPTWGASMRITGPGGPVGDPVARLCRICSCLSR
jgi:hypothetical protein